MESLKELYRIGSGPSSSHTMGPEKASKYILNNYKDANRFVVFLYGSLALTGKGHLTDYIIKKTLGENRTTINFDYQEKMPHPNTFKVEIYKDEALIDTVYFTSIGGGEILINGKKNKEVSTPYDFKDFKEICDYAKENNIGLEEVVYRFEDKDIKEYLKKVYETMVESIKRGLSKDGYLPGSLNVKRKAKQIYDALNEDSLRDKVIAYAYAVSEENASGNKIVTSPTCGSSGVLPACLYYYENKGYSIDKIIDALAVAGLIGTTIKENASISGAYLGCQAEVGTACSMAAGALSYLEGGSFEMIDCAAEIAMEHHLGLTCDPVDGLVQIPCIERNAVAALRAIDACKMSLLPIYPEKITFDSVIKTMLETGKDIRENYKETSKGGLALSKIKRE